MGSEGPTGRRAVGVLPRRVKYLLVLQSLTIGFLVFWFGEEYENNQYLQAYLNKTIAENGEVYGLLASMVIAILGAVAYARLKIQNMKAERAFRAELARQARETFALTKRRTAQRPRRETLRRAEASSTLYENESSVIRLEEPEAGVADQRRFEDVSPPVSPSGKVVLREGSVKTAKETRMPVLESEASPIQPNTPTAEDAQTVHDRPLARVGPLPRHVVAKPMTRPSQDRGLAPLSRPASPSGLNRVGPPPILRPVRRTLPSLRGPVFRDPTSPPPGLAGLPLTHRVVKQRVGEGPMDNPLPENSLLPVRRVVSRQGLNRVAPLRPTVPGRLEQAPIDSSGMGEKEAEVPNVTKQELEGEGIALKRVPVARRVDLDESDNRQAGQQAG